MSLEWTSIDPPLSPWILSAISAIGFPQMTPVQASTIPLFMKNKDVIVEAVTGSGKTLSFVIPVLEKLMRSEAKEPMFAMVISPTRELSLQIEKVFHQVLQYDTHENGIKTQAIIGGVNSLQQDFDNYKKNKPHIVIATPGRLLEFLNLNVSVKNLEILVLDEADKLLDLNFNNEMNKILPMLPKQKRIGLFSATILNATMNFYKTSMRNPTKIIVSSKNHKPKSLKLTYHITKPSSKIQHLLHFLNTLHYRKSIVYFPTCVSVEHFHSLLTHISEILNLNISFYSLHGKLKTPARIKTLSNFTDNADSKVVLLTTDVASRGIDILGIDLVIQVDPPTDPDVFLHRCGRTGRAGEQGTAISLISEGREEDYVDFLQVKNIELEELTIEENEISIDEGRLEKTVQEWVLEDRARHDKAVLSYVSFIRYYSKHTASSIFRLQSLDYLGIAKMYGVLRLPKMPEIAKYLKDSPEGGVFNVDIDFKEFKYLNPKKEEMRLEELANEEKRLEKLTKKKERAQNNVSWSKNSGEKNAKSGRFLQRELKKRKAELALKGESDTEENVEDWKEVVKKSKKEKKQKKDQGIGQFDDL